VQSRLESLLESSLNTASGFAVSFAAWRWVVVPLLGLPVDNAQNLIITGFFTVLSVARSYLWRRYFNGRLHFGAPENPL